MQCRCNSTQVVPVVYTTKMGRPPPITSAVCTQAFTTTTYLFQQTLTLFMVEYIKGSGLNKRWFGDFVDDITAVAVHCVFPLNSSNWKPLQAMTKGPTATGATNIDMNRVYV